MIDWQERLKDENIQVIGYAEPRLNCIYEPVTKSFWRCIDSMESYFEIKNMEMPKYAYAAYLIPFQLELDTILIHESYNHYDDILEDLNSVEELEKAINEFNNANNANKATGTYVVDYEVIVKLFEM